MNLAIELLGVGLIVPAAIAGVLAWCALQFGDARRIQLYALPAAVAVAYSVSYALLPEWAALAPERHWHWLPYLGLAAAVLGPAGLAAGRPAWTRALAMTALAVGAAYLLVPAWPDLQPPRRLSIALVAVYLSSLILAVEWLGPRVSTAWLLGLLALGGGALTITVAALVSVRFGVLAAMVAGALAGCWLACMFYRKSSLPDSRCVAPLFAVLVGGAAYVGGIEPQPPLWWLLLIPAIPLAIGAFVWQFTQYRASAGSAQ
jgi:hypothetical protein